jgi:uncharacterized protein (UPF0335 family)
VSNPHARERVRSFINRIERLEEERKALSSDISEVYAEAKGEGFNTKVMRKVIQRRKMDKADLQEEDAMLEIYEEAANGGKVVEDDPLA